MKRCFTSTNGLLLAVLLAGSALQGRDDRAQQDFHYAYDLRAGGHLDLTNVNGTVEVVGWDRNSIDISGTKYAPDNGSLDQVKIKVDANGDTARISTEAPITHGWRHGNYGVNYRIRVPRRIRLDRLETTNGQIRAEDLEGGGRVSSTNGRLSLTHLVGDYRVSTTNGSIELQECSGDEKAETTNGSIRGRQKAGAIEADSTNGSIDLMLEQPGDHKPIRISTTNGGVTLALAQYRDNPIKAETTHGAVNVRLPGDTNALLNAETSMGSISNDFSLSSTEQHSRHTLRGKLGNGGPEIVASSSMGAIRIQRY